MNPAHHFEVLGRKQLAIQEGIGLLEQAQLDLARARAGADKWGAVAIMANVTIIPLNCILNAYGLALPRADSIYQRVKQALARKAYDKFAASGSRTDGALAQGLSALKEIVTDELKRKAKTNLVPSANILIGLAEDSLAAWQAIQLVDGGSHEMTTLSLAIERKIRAANQHLLRLGIERADLLQLMQRRAHTA
jgi:hypothetical protein